MVRRTGRIARRAGYSAAHLLLVRRFRRAALGLPPFAKASRGAGLGGPHAAGAAPRPHFSRPLEKSPQVGGDAGKIRAAGETGITFRRLNFCGSVS
jgi:hypothetical protein